MNGPEYFADVILPLALPQLYTYEIPAELMRDAMPGKRAVVQFGKQKIYSALIRRIHSQRPGKYETKLLDSIIDEHPIVSEMQFQFWEWMAEYYMCTTGEVMAAALPSALKLESETVVLLHPDFEPHSFQPDEKELIILSALESKDELTLNEVSKITGLKSSVRIVKQMMEKGMLIHQEELQKNFKPSKVELIRLADGADDEFLKKLLDDLEKKAPQQFRLMMTFLKLKSDSHKDMVHKKKLLKAANSSSAILNQLIRKNALKIVEEETFFIEQSEAPLIEKSCLSPAQEETFRQISEIFLKQDTVLLHGVTSSGKTEIYIHLIEKFLKNKKQVLYLLPEIALTTQIINRLKRHFGNRLLVYHSRFNERQRAEVWNKMVLFKEFPDPDHFQVIIGARSASLLPYTDLGLIIVDEEHDSSYKQTDPAPRYHARDASIMLGKFSGAKIILGSATPAIESYFNAQSGKYGLVALNTRYADVKLPEIEIVDIKDAARRKKMKAFFSDKLMAEMEQALENSHQVILFQNRRGFSPYIECRNCHWVPHCRQCDVSLTFHKKRNQLVCHYCGYAISIPAKCSACGDPDLRMSGYGTERIEDEIGIFFPDKIVARLDYDSTRSKSSYHQIISGFENREIDILTGTQMVTKGLDFDNVSLVGILNADNQLNFPEFRAYERGFQLMLQVSGRAGRKFKQGKVIVQTWNPDHPVIEFVVKNDYEGFFRYEQAERQRFLYPPFCRITEIRLKHRNEKELESKSLVFAKELKKVFGNRVMGPVIPHVAKIRNMFQRNILLKAERGYPSRKFRKQLYDCIDHFKQDTRSRSVIVQIDVDPV